MRWLIVGAGVPGIDYATLAFARAVWSLPILILAAAIKWPKYLVRADLRLFVLLAVLNTGMNVLFPLAAQKTSAAHLTLIYGANAPIVALFESIFRKVSLDRLGKWAATFGALGVLIVSVTKSTTGASLQGDVILIVWLIGFGVQAVVTRVLAARYSSAFVIGFAWGMSAIIMIVCGLPFGLQDGLGPTVATPAVAAVFLGLIVVGMTFLAPVAFTRAAKSTSAAIATGATYYLAMCVGIVLALTLLHEQLRAGGIAGAVLLAVAIGLMMVPRRDAYAPVGAVS